MALRLYYQLSTRSRRAIKRLKKRTGYPYTYNPKGNLLERLARDNGMSIDEARHQLMREREELIRSGGIG